MDLINGGNRSETGEIKYVWTISEDDFVKQLLAVQKSKKKSAYNFTRHNDAVPMLEMERLMSIISERIHYSRKDILSMHLPNFSALLATLQDRK